MPERVAHILADYANEVRKLAYTLPSGVAETEALRLSKKWPTTPTCGSAEVPPHAATCRPPARPSETPCCAGATRPWDLRAVPAAAKPLRGKTPPRLNFGAKTFLELRLNKKLGQGSWSGC